MKEDDLAEDATGHDALVHDLRPGGWGLSPEVGRERQVRPLPAQPGRGVEVRAGISGNPLPEEAVMER